MRQALELALEALTYIYTETTADEDELIDQAITAIKEALAQPEQEPYCWTWDEWVGGGRWRAEYGWEKPERQVTNLQPLYTTPPQRKPLTDEQIEQLEQDTCAMEFPETARAIEAAHGIKE